MWARQTAKSRPRQCKTRSSEWRDTRDGEVLAQPSFVSCWTESLPEKKLGIHLEIEGRVGEWGMVQSISAQGRMAQSVQMPAVFLRGHNDWFPPWQRAATTPMVVFKCLVYGSQNRGWVYPSKQPQFKWHFKTNSWHLSGSEANRFMNTKSLFINITWIHFCGIYSLFGALPLFQRMEESWHRSGWGEGSERFNGLWRDGRRL